MWVVQLFLAHLHFQKNKIKKFEIDRIATHLCNTVRESKNCNAYPLVYSIKNLFQFEPFKCETSSMKMGAFRLWHRIMKLRLSNKNESFRLRHLSYIAATIIFLIRKIPLNRLASAIPLREMSHSIEKVPFSNIEPNRFGRIGLFYSDMSVKNSQFSSVCACNKTSDFFHSFRARKFSLFSNPFSLCMRSANPRRPNSKVYQE